MRRQFLTSVFCGYWTESHHGDRSYWQSLEVWAEVALWIYTYLKAREFNIFSPRSFSFQLTSKAWKWANIQCDEYHSLYRMLFIPHLLPAQDSPHLYTLEAFNQVSATVFMEAFPVHTIQWRRQVVSHRWTARPNRGISRQASWFFTLDWRLTVAVYCQRERKPADCSVDLLRSMLYIF